MSECVRAPMQASVQTPPDALAQHGLTGISNRAGVAEGSYLERGRRRGSL